MTHDEAFLQAILDDPADDTVRLIYADWLEERGDPRGEFIRVQVELARAPVDAPSRAEWEAREEELLSAHETEWLFADWPRANPDGTLFLRGFVTELSCQGANLGDAGMRVLARSPQLSLLTGLDLRSNRRHLPPTRPRLSSGERLSRYAGGCERDPRSGGIHHPRLRRGVPKAARYRVMVVRRANR